MKFQNSTRGMEIKIYAAEIAAKLAF
jgi:hypothetical protein